MRVDVIWYTAAYLAEAPPLKVSVQAGNIHMLAQGVSCVCAEVQQVREKMGLVNAHNLHAYVLCLCYSYGGVSMNAEVSGLFGGVAKSLDVDYGSTFQVPMWEFATWTVC